MSAFRFGPDNPAETYAPQASPEQTLDTGEAVINYAASDRQTSPRCCLSPGKRSRGGDMSRRWACSRSISRRSRSTCAGREDRAGHFKQDAALIALVAPWSAAHPSAFALSVVSVRGSAVRRPMWTFQLVCFSSWLTIYGSRVIRCDSWAQSWGPG